MISVPATPYDHLLPLFRVRRATERYPQGSSVAHAIVRGEMFMEDWLALVGSSIPLRGAEAATLHRSFKFPFPLRIELSVGRNRTRRRRRSRPSSHCPRVGCCDSVRRLVAQSAHSRMSPRGLDLCGSWPSGRTVIRTAPRRFALSGQTGCDWRVRWVERAAARIGTGGWVSAACRQAAVQLRVGRRPCGHWRLRWQSAVILFLS